MRIVQVNGGEAAARELHRALADALAGGPAVFPLTSGPASDGVLAAMRPADPVPPAAAVLVATSGSTGHPKGVLLSAAALRASADATHSRLGGPGRWLLATPAQYIGGLQVLVRALRSRTEPGVLDLRPGFRPAGFAAAAEPVLAEGGPHYTALVPTQLLRLLDAGGAGLDAARAFDAIVVGGAALPPDLRTRARSAGVPVVGAYGMTETCGGCVYDGRPLDGVQTRIGPTGRIQLAGSVLALGYRNPQDGGLSFDDGWLETDDLGRIADGRLEVLGRADDVINTGGVKVAAAAVEQALRGHPAVRAACVVGLPDDQWGQRVAALVVAADPEQPPPAAALAERVRAAAGRAAAPKVVRFAGELPLRGPGKVDRTEVRRLLQTHEPFTS